MVGWDSTPKKSSDRRWPSRCSSRVSMLAVWIVTDTDDSRGFSPMSIVPATSEKRPRTLDTMRWRAANPTSLWLASRAYAPAAGRSSPSMTRRAGLAVVGLVVRLMASPPNELRLAIVVVASNIRFNRCVCKFYSGYRGEHEPTARRREADRRGALLRDRRRAGARPRPASRHVRVAPRLARGAPACRPVTRWPAADVGPGRPGGPLPQRAHPGGGQDRRSG